MMYELEGLSGDVQILMDSRKFITEVKSLPLSGHHEDCQLDEYGNCACQESLYLAADKILGKSHVPDETIWTAVRSLRQDQKP